MSVISTQCISRTRSAHHAQFLRIYPLHLAPYSCLGGTSDSVSCMHVECPVPTRTCALDDHTLVDTVFLGWWVLPSRILYRSAATASVASIKEIKKKYVGDIMASWMSRT